MNKNKICHMHLFGAGNRIHCSTIHQLELLTERLKTTAIEKLDKMKIYHTALNVVQYALLTHMMARVAGLEAGELVHVIADAHIYDRHLDLLKPMMENSTKPAPELLIDPSVTDFYSFTKDHFKLEGYEPNAFEEKIPIAI